jgi:hypothetical protein
MAPSSARTPLGIVLDAAACRSKLCPRPSRTGLTSQPDASCGATQPFPDSESLIFLDETGSSIKMERVYGWAPVGEHCHDSVPFGYWKTMTFAAGLRLTGMTRRGRLMAR